VSTEVQRGAALGEPEWRGLSRRHRDRVEPWIRDRRSRRSAGRTHPVDDFLFDYYPYSTQRLATWHPGHGVELRGDVREFLAHPDYRPTASGAATDPSRVTRHLTRLSLALRLLARTAAREAHFGCFGMHEWAMVHGQQQDQVRHSAQPLRLPPGDIIDVVDAVGLRCTHLDAYRFFTSSALPLNAHRPTRADQHEWEQPGCLHANMDLYKYASWFSPYVGSDLVADCFELARAARAIDMRAAPYDLRDLGYPPILIETPAGRRQYAREQQSISEAAEPLRTRLHDALLGLQSTASVSERQPS
jgi:hypothetical protein